MILRVVVMVASQPLVQHQLICSYARLRPEEQLHALPDITIALRLVNNSKTEDSAYSTAWIDTLPTPEDEALLCRA